MQSILESPPYFWQKTQWDSLIKRKLVGNMPHAFLLTGMQGLGKTAFANQLAKALLCAENQTNACGQCRYCELFAAETHPDFYRIKPVESGKKIKVDQIRELILQLNQTAQQNNNKVAVIESAEAMHHAAANALLKTLEEPSKKTFIILVTDNLFLLPATIRSRCQIIKFSAPPFAAALAWLQQFVTSDVELLLSFAEGAPLKALSYAQEEILNKHLVLLTDLEELLKGKDPVKIASGWLKEPSDFIITYLIIIITDIIYLQFSLVNNRVSDKQYASKLANIIHKVNRTNLFIYLDKLYTVRREMLLSNLNQQLLLEELFCTWAGLNFINN